LNNRLRKGRIAAIRLFVWQVATDRDRFIHSSVRNSKRDQARMHGVALPIIVKKMPWR
jgi:hypothetical protein